MEKRSRLFIPRDRGISSRVTAFICVVLWTACVLYTSAVCISALADADISATLRPEDIQENEAIQRAAAFFAVKCGLDKQTLLDATWDCFFAPAATLEEAIQASANGQPCWTLYVKNTAEGHHRHVFVMTRSGELLFWSAHGSNGYTVADPDILADARFVQPMPTDAQGADVAEAFWAALLAQGAYSEESIQDVILDGHFIYHEQFNQGISPVWIIYAQRAGVKEWKAAYAYTGECMSLVPFEQDFTCYWLENEDFWYGTFGAEQGFEEKGLLAEIMVGNMSPEKQKETAERWRPYLERWIKEHPYYMNAPGAEYDLVFGK